MPILGQSIFESFGVKPYGNSFDQPFYEADNIHQDSLNRLIFRYSSKFKDFDKNMHFDGQNFIKNEPLGKGEFQGVDSLHNVTWYKPDLFTAVAYRGDSIFTTIHTNDYFELNFHYVYQHNDLAFLVTNSGLLEFEWNEGKLLFSRKIPISTANIYRLEVIGDTLFCKTNKGTKYKLYSDISIEYSYGKHDSYNFQLPGNRIIRKDNKTPKILSSDSWIHNVLSNSNHSIQHYLEDRKGRLWTYDYNSSTKGLNVYENNKTTGTLVKTGIPENTNILDLYEDHEGSIWIGTRGKGLIQVYEKTIQVLNTSVGLSSDNISSIEQDKMGNIFFATECSGVDIIRSDLSLEHFRSNNCQKIIYESTKGDLWFAGFGLQRYRNETYIKHYLKKEGLHSRTIKCLFEDSKSQLWAGTRQAIHKFENDKFEPYLNDSISFFNRLFNIVELADGTLLLAYSDGEIFTFSDGKYSKVNSPTDKVSHLYKDIEQRIWIATEGDGLHRYIDGVIEKIDEANLLSASISFLQEDLLGNLWTISEDHTIKCVNKDLLWNSNDVMVTTYTVDDGLPLIHNNKRIQPAAELLHNGKIIFPNIHGAIVIDPLKIKREKEPYHTIIKHQDSVYHVQSTIELDDGINDIQMSIHNISLHPHNHFEIQYGIEDDTWTPVKDPNQITITNLPYGKNELNLRSRYTGEKWKTEEITIIAPPPYYYSWWFALIILLITIWLISLLVKWRTGIVKQQNILLEEKVSQQTKELLNEKEQLANSLDLQQKLTHELNLSQATKNRMYAQISHEFKSPLQAINSYLSSSDDYISQDDKKRITGNIKQLLDISSEIMDLSKAESGALKAKKDFYNINNIIQEQIELKSSLIREKEIHVEFKNTDKRSYLYCDISLMQKVVNNLLSNAIKFSDKGDSIIILSEDEKNFRIISVIDEGVGIPEKEIENLTLAYFQASNNNEKGTGIGLSLVDKILQLHDSQLKISSKLGKGSKFSFAIEKPKFSSEEIHTKHFDEIDIPTQLSNIINNNKETILAIDDSLDILHFVRRTLSQKYNIITTTNGLLAIENLKNINPSLILSDVNMPIVSGTEILKTIRSISEFESIPFLLLTGSVSEETELVGLRSGADFVLQKPIEADFLKSQIKQILNRQNKVIDRAKEKFVHGLLPKKILDDDRKLMLEVENVILDRLDNPKLLSEDIAKALGLGEKTLRNKVKSITGYTVKEYLKNFRLEKAKLLLEQNYGTKGEIAASVGFSSLSYFSKSYKKYFAK